MDGTCPPLQPMEFTPGGPGYHGVSAAGLQLHLYDALPRPVVNFGAARLFINKTGSPRCLMPSHLQAFVGFS